MKTKGCGNNFSQKTILEGNESIGNHSPQTKPELSLSEQIELDEKMCVPGSLAYDKKEKKMIEEEIRSRAVAEGGFVSNQNA